MKKNPLPLSWKVNFHKAKKRLQIGLTNILRNIPFLNDSLGIPKGTIRSLKKHIDDRRAEFPWSRRMDQPAYFNIAPPILLKSQLANQPTGKSEPDQYPLINKTKYHYNYWDIRSGYDSRKGFARKSIIRFDEVFMAYLPNAKILGPNGSVITDENLLVEESLWTWENWVNKDRARTSVFLPKYTKVDFPCYVVTSKYCEGYPHWLMEALPRLFGLTLLPKELKPTLIFPIPLKQWHIDTITLLGFGDYPRMALQDGYIKAQDVYFPSYVGMPGTPHPTISKWVVDRIKSNFEIGQKKERIYITRRLAPRRTVVNEAELLPILEKYGFTILEAETLFFADQVQLFARAEAIVSSHGAGLANIMFAPPGCKVLEVLDKDYVNDHYYNLSQVFQLEYYFQLCTSINADNNLPLSRSCDDISINPQLFERSLNVMFVNKS